MNYKKLPENQIKKICFLAISPFSKRDYQRFAIEEIQNLGFEVLVLDCTPFLDKRFENYISGNELCFKNKNIKRCYSLMQFLKDFIGFNPNWTIDHIPVTDRNKYFYRLFMRLIVKITSNIIHYRLFSLPQIGNLPNNEDKKFVFLKKIRFILRRIIYLPYEIMCADKVVVGGYLEFLQVKDKNKAILAHNLDYDNFLEMSRKKYCNNPNPKNLIFLDEDFPCHSDFFREGTTSEICENEYFDEMSYCLESLGKILNLKPIVKLHPRANTKKSSRLYTVDISFQDTVKLVQNSELVVAHQSTSIQLAVLFYKPIILIIPNKLPKNSMYNLMINKFKDELDIPCFRTKDVLKIKYLPKVNFKKYDQYKEKFIKMKSSEDKFSWEILVKNLGI